MLAPDWRGFGLSEWPRDGYWFADYVADLDGLVRALAPRRCRGHRRPQSRWQRRAACTPACGRDASRNVVSLDGFGIPGEGPRGRAGEVRDMAGRAERRRCAGAVSRACAAVADRLQKNNPPAAARQGASSWPRIGPNAAAGWHGTPARPIRATSFRFRRVYRLEEVFAIWRNDRGARAVGRGGRLVRSRDGSRTVAAIRTAEIARRMAHVPGARW